MATQAEIEAAGVAKEVAANKRMTAPGFVGNAAAYERDANRRSIEEAFGIRVPSPHTPQSSSQKVLLNLEKR